MTTGCDSASNSVTSFRRCSTEVKDSHSLTKRLSICGSRLSMRVRHGSIVTNRFLIGLTQRGWATSQSMACVAMCFRKCTSCLEQVPILTSSSCFCEESRDSCSIDHSGSLWSWTTTLRTSHMQYATIWKASMSSTHRHTAASWILKRQYGQHWRRSWLRSSLGLRLTSRRRKKPWSSYEEYYASSGKLDQVASSSWQSERN